MLGTPGLRPWTEKRDVTSVPVAGASGFEQNSDRAPGREGPTSLGSSEGETGSLTGWGNGSRLVQKAEPLYLVNQKALGRSLLGVA